MSAEKDMHEVVIQKGAFNLSEDDPVLRAAYEYLDANHGGAAAIVSIKQFMDAIVPRIVQLKGEKS